MKNEKCRLTAEEHEEILRILKDRFEENISRHKGLNWYIIQAKLETSKDKLYSLYQMEKSGGEPDVIAYYPEEDVYIFCDCSKETPEGRRNVCYDREALESRKKTNHKTTLLIWLPTWVSRC